MAIGTNCMMLQSRVYDDEQILGAHLVNDHGMKRKGDFNTNYSLFILANCNPTSLRTTEKHWIDKLRICDFRVYDIGERTAQPPEIQITQVWYQNKGMVILFRFQKKISF